ncbi:hypothetical protein [Persicitalea sp.]|uniref:hypothetical protein n=1 Tax=Persicitalea sp. TaxID=3100273 RepID=UPI003594878D
MKLRDLKSSAQVLLVVLALFLSPKTTQAQKEPPRRANSPFGLHFDFHAQMRDSLIGKTVTEGMVDSLLTRVKPDFIQVDCKGHAGFTSYPTEVGNRAGGFVNDPLKIFRKVTKKHGVALYVHYSGVWDDRAVQLHPHWARIDADVKPDPKKVSFWSAYSDSLLIPQLKEISDYGVDGVWIDGDSWAVEPDYRPDALAEFRQTTGITNVPKKKGDPHFDDLLEFTRQKFRSYIAHYAEALHKYNPKFQVASNWAFSSFMPEPINIPVDFISGDFSPYNSVESGAYEARCIAPQGKPWDLMAWSFGGDWTGMKAPKSAVQLSQEAAQVMAVGGGFQAYWSQDRDASLPAWAFDTMGELAEFCRARQPFCYQATPVPQVALYYSTTGQKHLTDAVYKSNFSQQALKGMLQLLLDNQLSTEIRMTHNIAGRMADYPLIVLPEWEVLSGQENEDLLNYVKDGGTLLVIGPKAVDNFAPALGVALGDLTPNSAHFGSAGRVTAGTTGYRNFTPRPGTQTFGGAYSRRDLRYLLGPAASIATYGKGKIAAVYVGLADTYLKNESHNARRFVGELVEEIYDPMVKVTGSQFVYLAVNRKNDKLMVNLLNLAGPHKSAAAFDEVPPLGPLQVQVKYPKRPGKITLQPDGTPLPYEYKNGQIIFTLQKLDIHSIIEVD